MSLGSFLFGKRGRNEQFSKYAPGVQNLINQNLTQGLQGMQGGGFDFAPIEQKARTNFSTQTIPSLAERFTAMGGGANSSSAFGGAMGQAGAGLEESLAGMKQNYNLQQQQLLQQLLGLGQMENMYRPETGGLMGSLAGPLSKMGLKMGNSAAMSHGLYGRGMMEGMQGLGGEGFDLSKLASLAMFL